MRTGKRNIKDGYQYDQFFTTAPKGEFLTIKKEASLGDTLDTMKQVIAKTLDQTKEIANHLQGASVWKSCKRVWNFCFSYFQYTKDEERKEQIRHPSRSWRDRKAGIDCDCFTVLIGSILTNMGIPFAMRMTRYKAVDFEHIYPVAESPEGEEIIIDCVVHQFNYEVPYTQKKDVEMELQVLNGVEGERFNEFGDKVHFENDLPIDAEDLFLDDMELQGLEGRAERQARKKKRKAKRSKRRTDRKEKIAEFKKLPLKEKLKRGLKKGINIINKLNPGAALLRGGILASMKLNLFKVSSKIRFSYWSEAEARKNGMDMSKYNQLQRIREKLEKIYFGAGGETRALKKAILTGKGNKNKMVRLNGLGSVIDDHISDDDDLRTILGEDLFFEELHGFEGLDGLGEPASIATGAAVTAAAGVIGTIAGLIKKVGGSFKKGSSGEQKAQIQENGDDAEEKTRKFSFSKLKNAFQKAKGFIQNRKARKNGQPAQAAPLVDPAQSTQIPMDEFDNPEFSNRSPIQNEESSEQTAEGESDSKSKEDDEKKSGGFVQWVKDNKVAAGLIGAGILAGGGYLIYRAVKKPKAKKPALAGAPKIKKTKKHSKTKVSARKKTSRKAPRKSSPKAPRKSSRKPRKKTTSNIPKVELL